MHQYPKILHTFKCPTVKHLSLSKPMAAVIIIIIIIGWAQKGIQCDCFSAIKGQMSYYEYK